MGSADLGADAQTRRSLTRGAGGSALRCSRPQALWGSAGSPKASPATRDGCSLSPVTLALTAYDCGRRPAPRFFATPVQVTPVCKHPTNCVLIACYARKGPSERGVASERVERGLPERFPTLPQLSLGQPVRPPWCFHTTVQAPDRRQNQTDAIVTFTRRH